MTDFYRLDPEQQAEGLRRLGREALHRWGIEDADLSVIKMRENAVFRVDIPSGDRVALRIHRHDYHTDVALTSELQWMKALQKDGIDVPRIRPSVLGALFEVVESEPVPEPRQVDVFEWIDGEQLGAAGEGLGGDLQTIEHTFHILGELCARVHNQSAAWRLPAGFERHAWDEEALTGDNPLWGRFWELQILSDAERDLIERARAAVRDDLADLGKSAESYSVIHADIVPENVLVHDGRLQLVDFDDAGFGWHLFEIATALYFHTREDYYPTARDALIAGYRAHRELSDAALARLPIFMAARGFTYLGWIHTRSETATARELGPMYVELACRVAEEYLANGA
jgi:Ser/Thr protein kinase RdoA (MazF antagonist)